eukprot:2066246-Pleurochrysis_carterae.AAC.1
MRFRDSRRRREALRCWGFRADGQQHRETKKISDLQPPLFLVSVRDECHSSRPMAGHCHFGARAPGRIELVAHDGGHHRLPRRTVARR